MSQFAALTVLATLRLTVLPALVAISQLCLTKPLCKPVCPLVVPIIAPIDRSWLPSITELPSILQPTPKSPDPTGHDRESATSLMEVVPAGAINARLESPKFDVRVTWLVVSVCPLAVLVMYWGILSLQIVRYRDFPPSFVPGRAFRAAVPIAAIAIAWINAVRPAGSLTSR